MFSFQIFVSVSISIPIAMEYTVKTWRGYTYTMLRPGKAKGSETKTYVFGQLSERSANRTPVLCTDPHVYARPLARREEMDTRPRRRRVVSRRMDLYDAGV